MDLRKELKKYGLTETQMNAKAVSCMEDIVINNSNAIDKMAFDRLNSEVAKSAEVLKKINESAARNEDMMNRAEKAVREYKNYADSLKNNAILNPDTRDALNLYTSMLTATKEIFGEENLTENVMIKLLETASYGMWRSIMGSKNGDSKAEKPSTAWRY